MTSPAEFRAIALSMPQAHEGSHFDVTDFRVANRIFATWREDRQQAVLKLTPDDQSMLLETMPNVLSRIPGGWGAKGWSRLDLPTASDDEVRHLITLAWRTVAPKKLLKA